MRLVLIILCGILSLGASKINMKALTESMGQEVIEIGPKIKDLPPDLEEEPSAEADDVDKGTSTTLETATPRETRRDTFQTIESRRKLKDINKIDNVKQEDDEARIEKELAEMYKDTDYKADSVEASQEPKQITVITQSTANDTDRPIARMRENFKFQPDRNNPREIERFRTSVDDINCGKNKLVSFTKVTNSGHIPALCGAMLWGSFVLLKNKIVI